MSVTLDLGTILSGALGATIVSIGYAVFEAYHNRKKPKEVIASDIIWFDINKYPLPPSKSPEYYRQEHDGFIVISDGTMIDYLFAASYNKQGKLKLAYNHEAKFWGRLPLPNAGNIKDFSEPSISPQEKCKVEFMRLYKEQTTDLDK